MTKESIPSNILSLQEILEQYSLCDSCIGRLLGSQKNANEYTSEGKNQRHKRGILALQHPEDCELCEGLSYKQEYFIKLCQETLMPYEYSTFLIGFRVHEDILQKEQELMTLLGLADKESLKNYLNRYIGLALEDLLGKQVDFLNPDIMIIVDSTFDIITLQVKSLFIYGRYLKLIRDLPQTKWFCKYCRGKGCRRCKYTGTLYKHSIEEFISMPILKITGGTDESFHGAGREDIDVRMLGSGRPFVLEIKHPKIRTINLHTVQQEINLRYGDMVTIQNLSFTQKETISKLKEARYTKVYRVTIQGEHSFDKEKLIKVAETLRGQTIDQFTPTRVELRRALLTRKRTIFDCNVEKIEKNRATCIIEAESGTYIKELITGDNGKTQPSFSSLLGISLTVCSLDVIEIKGA
jgi:tRNA pseudouridine synthase 10